MTQETILLDLARHACINEFLYERRCIVLFWSCESRFLHSECVLGGLVRFVVDGRPASAAIGILLNGHED
jgi:hypothetical protein